MKASSFIFALALATGVIIPTTLLGDIRNPNIKAPSRPTPKPTPKPAPKIPDYLEYHDVDGELCECLVFFNYHKSVIQTEEPGIKKLASFLKSNPEARVTIDGYADKDGPAKLNEKLAEARAQAVKKFLVENCGISPARIQAQGMGIGSMFSEGYWNDVAICTCHTPSAGLNLSTTVFFQKNCSQPREYYYAMIARSGAFLKNNPSYNLRIVGYISPLENKANANKLSLERAEAVKSILVNKYGISSSRIQTRIGGLLNVSWGNIAICTMLKD